MGRVKNGTLYLPPDFIQVEKLLTPSNIVKLKTLATTGPIKIYFINPVESLDIFFLVNYLFSLELENLNVDFYTSDPILLKKASDGFYFKSEVEEYCFPQNLPSEHNWIKLLSNDKMQVDPRLLLKIQFHWMESTEQVPKLISHSNNHHLVITGPVFSDSYEQLPMNKILPCYQVELNFSA